MQSGIVGAFVIVAPTWTQPDTSTPSTSTATRRVTTSYFNSNTQPGQLNGLRAGVACIRPRGESTTARQTTGSVSARSSRRRGLGCSEHALPPAGTILNIRVVRSVFRAENFTLRLGCRCPLKFLDIDRRRRVLRLPVVRAVIIRRRVIVAVVVIRVWIVGIPVRVWIVGIPEWRSDEAPAVEACVVVMVSAPCTASVAPAAASVAPAATTTRPSPLWRCSNS